jgi:hypothetical protein
MKTIKYFCALLACLAVISCSGDDDNPGIDQTLILGEWDLVEYNYSGNTTVTQGGSTITSSYIGEFYDVDAQLIFSDNNTYSTAGSYMVKLTTTYEGETMVQDVPSSDVASTGTYRIENNKLITDVNPQLQQPGDLNMVINEGTIVELTSNRLVLSFDHDLNTTVEGMEMTINVEGVQVYSR